MSTPGLVPLLAGLGAAAALWWLLPATARHRPSAREASAAPSEPRASRGRWLWGSLAGVGTWALLGGAAGAPAGVVVALGVARFVDAGEGRRRRRDEEAARRDLPAAVLLLAVALRSGSAVEAATRQVCAALPGAATARLAATGDRLGLGVDPARVWADLAADPALTPLGRTLARAHRSGAPVAAAVERLADELAAAARARTEDRARAVGVRAAVPLGVCLLPSFLLLGIVPLVAGLLGDLQL